MGIIYLIGIVFLLCTGAVTLLNIVEHCIEKYYYDN